MEDLSIVSDTHQLHLDRLEQAFTALHKQALRLKEMLRNLNLLQLRQYSVDFKLLRKDLWKAAGIERIPTPTTVKELKVVLGITGFYGRFSARYTAIAVPYTSMLAGEQKFQWSTHCQDAFNTLKRKLSTAVILAHRVAAKPFVLTSDASTLGIGAELAQEYSEGLRPIA